MRRGLLSFRKGNDQMLLQMFQMFHDLTNLRQYSGDPFGWVVKRWPHTTS